jgi:ABC-type nickel/cobalt efflux system permease component RcnA
MLDQLIVWQRWIYVALSADLSAFASTRDWPALAAVLPVGIAFGAVHALTPGHGKAVLASYLVGSRLALARAAAVAGVQALTHVGSAVILALIAIPLVTPTLGGVVRAPALEALSRSLLIGIGVWLVFRAARERHHSHREGFAVGVVAGLVPCPLTLFAMFIALGRGVPEAGLTFAASMMLGIGLTLGTVAFLSVMARDWVATFTARHGASLHALSRILGGSSGALLIMIVACELWH